MCDKNQLHTVLSEVSRQADAIFNDKLISVILYGSYARGDFEKDSDIDIMILADITPSLIVDYLNRLRDKIYKLEIEYDCVISLCITPSCNFEKYKNVSPFYKNVKEEGIPFAV